MVNAEIRVPFLGTEQFGLLNFPYLPTELVAFADGSAPATAVEIGRAQFFTTNRPSGAELLGALRGGS